MIQRPLSILLLLLTASLSQAELKIICPDSAPVGYPVTITVTGIPDGASVKFIKDGFNESDNFIELFDANKQPVTIFWSLSPGPRKLTYITAVNGDPSPVIEDVSHILKYGNPKPDPGPTPEPTPEPRLKTLVTPLKAFKIESEDRKDLGDFYENFPLENLETTAQFRERYVTLGSQKLNLKGKYQGLAEAIDSILASELGLEIVSLDKVKTKNLLNAIAWGLK